MRDRAAFDALAAERVDLYETPYDRLDCLESGSDLQGIFDVLSGHRDSRGSPPVLTFNSVMANPDFETIRAAGFERYAFEDLFQSYQRYHGEDLRSLWGSAIQAGLIRPQFHGREHLNVGLWLQDLRAGHRETRLAFDHDYYGHTTRTSSRRQTNYLAAFWPESGEHFEEIKDILVDGLNRFERIFGYRSRSFIACNYVLPAALEPLLRKSGVELIQGQRGQLRPSSDGSTVSVRRSFTGERNRNGQAYSVRNVIFEPFQDPTRDWVASALKEIRSAFFWGTPAIVSTHRVNYVSGMDMVHRDQNLRLLDDLLKKIIATWPDVEFVSSDELIPMMAT